MVAPVVTIRLFASPVKKSPHRVQRATKFSIVGRHALTDPGANISRSGVNAATTIMAIGPIDQMRITATAKVLPKATTRRRRGKDVLPDLRDAAMTRSFVTGEHLPVKPAQIDRGEEERRQHHDPAGRGGGA